MKRYVLLLTVLLLLLSLQIPLTAYAQGPSRRKAKKPVTVKAPVELAEQIIRDSEVVQQAMRRVAGADAAILAKHLDAQLIDLNFDGKPEYLISATCSYGTKEGLTEYGELQCLCDMHENCEGWIYRKTRDGFEMLLDSTAAPLKTRTNGYRDLSAGAVLGCCSTVENTFKFDGRRYVVVSRKETRISPRK